LLSQKKKVMSHFESEPKFNLSFAITQFASLANSRLVIVTNRKKLYVLDFSHKTMRLERSKRLRGARVTVIAQVGPSEIALGFANGELHVVDTNKRRTTKFPAGFMPVTGITALPDKQFATSSGQTVNVWDLDTTAMSNTRFHHTQDIVRLSSYCADSFFASCSLDCTVRIWSARGKPIWVFGGYAQPLVAIAVVADGMFIVTASHEGTLFLLNTRTSERRVIASDLGIRSLAALKENFFASGETNGDVRIWDAQTGDCVQTLHCEHPVERLASLDNGMLVAGLTNGSGVVWKRAQ